MIARAQNIHWKACKGVTQYHFKSGRWKYPIGTIIGNSNNDNVDSNLEVYTWYQSESDGLWVRVLDSQSRSPSSKSSSAQSFILPRSIKWVPGVPNVTHYHRNWEYLGISAKFRVWCQAFLNVILVSLLLTLNIFQTLFYSIFIFNFIIEQSNVGWVTDCFHEKWAIK